MEGYQIFVIFALFCSIRPIWVQESVPVLSKSIKMEVRKLAGRLSERFDPER